MSTFNVTLAHAKNDKKINYPVYLQPKLDGIRCYFTKDGAFSRNHKQFFNVEHIELMLVDFFNENPNIILDGELYNHQLKNDFEKIVSLVRKQKPTDEQRYEAAGLIEYHIYDMFNTEQPDIIQLDRTNTLRELFTTELNKPFLVSVPTTEVSDDDDVQIRNQSSLDEGYEGSMLRSMNTPYKQKRSWDLQKVKSFKDTEATIIGVVEGKGKLQGAVGKFDMRDADGIEFSAPMTANSHVERRAAWDIRDQYVGKVATFTYFERTKYNSYRFPIFKSIRNYE